jgi:hypothetical protein
VTTTTSFYASDEWDASLSAMDFELTVSWPTPTPSVAIVITTSTGTFAGQATTMVSGGTFESRAAKMVLKSYVLRATPILLSLWFVALVL